MKCIPTGKLDRERDRFLVFLESCQEAARKDGHAKLVSISQRVMAIDPLAVLEAIYEDRSSAFYLENPQSGFAMAGAEPVVQIKASGIDRMQLVKAQAEEILAHAIAIGELDSPFSGPHFLGAFSFEDVVRAENPFDAASFFVPQWQMAVDGGEGIATANLWVDGDSPLEIMADRVLAAHERFSRFDFNADYVNSMNHALEYGDADNFRFAWDEDKSSARIVEALEHIHRGDLRKVVVAHRVYYEAARPFDSIKILNELRESYSGCYSFLFTNGKGHSFVGATPERLGVLQQKRFRTEAIAGSIRRGASMQEDAIHAQQLLQSEKDRAEHQFVVSFIRDALFRLGLVLNEEETVTRLMKLPNIFHLLTPIDLEVDASRHILDFVDVLHPTPALGGVPRERALTLISELEDFERGVYGAPLGYFNAAGEGRFVVGIRSAICHDNYAELYAGSGIVADSNVAVELQEIKDKLRPIREHLC